MGLNPLSLLAAALALGLRAAPAAGPSAAGTAREEHDLRAAPAGEVPAVSVLRSSVCAAIMDREPFPAGPASAEFASDLGMLYYWNDLAVSGSTGTVRHRWSIDGTRSLEVRLQARPPRTRTWSSARVRPGSWKVEVLSEAGKVLKSERFKVLP